MPNNHKSVALVKTFFSRKIVYCYEFVYLRLWTSLDTVMVTVITVPNQFCKVANLIHYSMYFGSLQV